MALAKILMIPTSSAICERGSSRQKKIQTNMKLDTFRSFDMNVIMLHQVEKMKYKTLFKCDIL